jgi:ubiquitin C-terminal hydrolase
MKFVLCLFLGKYFVCVFFAVVFHQGATVQSGHYVVITYDLITNGWVLKDDGHVRAISETELFRYYDNNKLNWMPYFLVYHRVGHNSNGPAAMGASS